MIGNIVTLKSDPTQTKYVIINEYVHCEFLNNKGDLKEKVAKTILVEYTEYQRNIKEGFCNFSSNTVNSSDVIHRKDKIKSILNDI